MLIRLTLRKSLFPGRRHPEVTRDAEDRSHVITSQRQHRQHDSRSDTARNGSQRKQRYRQSVALEYYFLDYILELRLQLHRERQNPETTGNGQRAKKRKKGKRGKT